MIGTGIVLSFLYPGSASLIMLSHLTGVPINGSPQTMAETTVSTVASEAKPLTTFESNVVKGAQFEETTGAQLGKEGYTGVGSQVTIKADNGVKTRVDFISNDPKENIALTEAKASATAPIQASMQGRQVRLGTCAL